MIRWIKNKNDDSIIIYIDVLKFKERGESFRYSIDGRWNTKRVGWSSFEEYLYLLEWNFLENIRVY